MEKYRNLKIKLTPQRLAILSFLDGNTSHPSAEDIYLAVKKRFPTISFATVYNTLETLKNKGTVQEIKIDPDKKRYDPLNKRHHHIICIKCKDIVDVHLDFDVDISEDMTEDFSVLGNRIEFYGICRKCGKKK
jgi:Fur family peroxide stress response transcriptional regulator